MNTHTQTPGNPAKNPATDAPQGVNSSTFSVVVTQCKIFLDLHHVESLIDEAQELIGLVSDAKNCREDSEYLREAIKSLQASLSKKLAIPEKPAPQPFKINSPRRVSIDDLIKQRNQAMGLKPLPLESDLLLQRIAQGGHSGQFLANAFISAYRTTQPFSHSLGELMKLDAEGFRLFHEILHIRYIPGWNDDDLYQIEQQIIALVGGAS